MKVYTGGGDKGKTSLFSGERVEKHNIRIAAYGDIDELNSWLGTILAFLPQQANKIQPDLTRIQSQLFQASAWLATTPDSSAVKFLDEITADLIQSLEMRIDELSDTLPVLKEFILPAGHQAAGMLHIARTVCRRCERKVSELLAEESTENIPVSITNTSVYLNRLSDYLFVAARYVNHCTQNEEQVWNK